MQYCHDGEYAPVTPSQLIDKTISWRYYRGKSITALAAAPRLSFVWCAKYQLYYISNEFRFVQKVCSHLISKGLQTLHEIVRGTGVPSPQVKQSLLLLIQHNYVSAYQHKDEDGPLNKPSKAPHHLYAANMDSIIQILRYLNQAGHAPTAWVCLLMVALKHSRASSMGV